MAITQADYIVVGGGLVGCALASRLKQGNSSHTVLVVEAGADPSDNPNVTSALGSFALVNSDVDWSYTTVPQKYTNNRAHSENAGKALGGGSVINWGGWSRGDASDYDEWAQLVGDDRWSYKAMLPFFRRSEHHLDVHADPQTHGFDGPIHVASITGSDPKRLYGLRNPVKAAFNELGFSQSNDSTGSSAGISEIVENWHNGLRQTSAKVYGLEGVEVMTETIVDRILFTKNSENNLRATAVQLADGRTVSANKEIIISAGAYNTPQILMLSGIGPADELQKHNIPLVVDAPHVGTNLFNHFAHFQLFNLLHPEKGLAMGTSLWTDPAFLKGLPCDWAINEPVPSHLLGPALKEDGEIDKHHPLLHPSRPHVEYTILYAGFGLPTPPDGTIIASSTMLLLPTSRGSVTISSASPTDPPVIDPNYYSTQADRTALVYGTRRVMQALMETSAGKDFVASEMVPPGLEPLSFQSTDAEIDARIRNAGVAHKHAGGSAAMGKVVGPDLCVYGVQGLRVADSSVLPIPVGGHPQTTLYALAEQAADMILQS
ncbi:hypothetical protein MMC27_008869 [Xylographa pallens]|nr:hypothetical protein [Xylographa pallens]